jgi:hypothetical protein
MKYAKTEAGQHAFKTRSPLLSTRQRSAFILFDGIKTSAQVLAATSGLGIISEDLEHLVLNGFLVATEVEAPVVVEPVASVEAAEVKPVPLQSSSMSDRSPQERYRDAMPIATKLTAGLGLRGFRLNLAVEGAADYFGLLALLPKIQEAVGPKLCLDLEQALKG